MSDEKKHAPSRPSGESPAVKTYRAKMESIADGETTAALGSLDAALEQFLKESSDPPPDTLPESIPPVCDVDPYYSGVCALGTKSCRAKHEE